MKGLELLNLEIEHSYQGATRIRIEYRNEANQEYRTLGIEGQIVCDQRETFEMRQREYEREQREFQHFDERDEREDDLRHDRYHDDREELKKALQSALSTIKFQHDEMERMRLMGACPEVADPNATVIVVDDKFKGSLEFALSEIGLKTEGISPKRPGLRRLKEDVEEEPEDDLFPPVCMGHAFLQHEPHEMARWDSEWQCGKCGNTMRA